MNPPVSVKRLITSLVGCLFILNASVGTLAQSRSSLDILKDRPLSEVEGLWSMTVENLLVLIIRNESGKLEMTIAPENIGSGFRTGSTVGYLEPTAETNTYWFYLEDAPKSKKNPTKSVLGTNPFSKRCILKHNEKDGILTIEKGDISISFNPLSYFPYLNRLIKLRFSNPNAKIREGFMKIAPGFDGGVASPRRPIYY